MLFFGLLSIPIKFTWSQDFASKKFLDFSGLIQMLITLQIDPKERACIAIFYRVRSKSRLYVGSKPVSSVARPTFECLLSFSSHANFPLQVYVMIWSDKTNFMGTHDDATQAFFKNSKVNCALVPRELQRNEFTDYLQNEFSSGTYTHHQKSIICDAPNPEGALRRLVAFVGGLDLTGGRWDTPGNVKCVTLRFSAAF